VRVSIVTPSFRGSDWLKLCLASVADQRVGVQHIVQDAGSDDGTLDWLAQDRRIELFVEKDHGMYDALNRGFRRCTGEILGYLNCDEQYLPGTLERVTAFFSDRPGIDMVFGNVIFTDRQGDYLWHRKMQVPLKYHTWTCHLSTLSCGMFFRRHLFFDRGLTFDPAYRMAGDADWMLRVIDAGVKMTTLGTFTSVFTQTGGNIGSAPEAVSENLALRRTAPIWARIARPLFLLHHRFRRFWGGMYSQAPFDFEVYTPASPAKRVLRQVRQPRFRPAR
jgi:glycosyltransferase involved in cell wall biosynthesis